MAKREMVGIAKTLLLLLPLIDINDEIGYAFRSLNQINYDCAINAANLRNKKEI